MAAMTKEQMTAEVDAYLAKLEALVGAGSGKYSTMDLAVGEVKTINLATFWPVATYELKSCGIDIKSDEPGSTPQAIIPAYNLVDWSINAAGVLTIKNNYTAAVKLYITLNPPVKK